MRLIDADNPKLRAALYTYTRFSGIYEAPDEHADQELDLAPTVERGKGKWVAKAIGSRTTWYVCSECGRSVVDDTGYDIAEAYPFCHCGADMRKEEE